MLSLLSGSFIPECQEVLYLIEHTNISIATLPHCNFHKNVLNLFYLNKFWVSQVDLCSGTSSIDCPISSPDLEPRHQNRVWKTKHFLKVNLNIQFRLCHKKCCSSKDTIFYLVLSQIFLSGTIYRLYSFFNHYNFFIKSHYISWQCCYTGC